MLYSRYLCILINILELCFRRQLNYLETVSDFYGLFLNFVTWYQSSLETRPYFSPQLRQYPSEYPTQCPMNYEVFPLCLLRTNKCSQLCLRIGHYYLQCFWLIRSPAFSNFLTCMWWILQLKTWAGNSWDLWSFLSVLLFPFWYSVLRTLAALAFPDSHLLLNHGHLLLHLGSFFLCCSLETLSKQ